MKTFQLIEQPFVPPVDLQTLNTAYNNLQQRHDEAIKATSELKTAVANLDLNESEEDFRNKLISDIEYTIDSNTRYGNSASSYDNIIKLQGDIASNPALISKLKAQQNYKQFITEIDARQDLPEHYKEYYKKINPYKEGVYDEQGNWIKGTKWEPIKKAALNIDKSIIMDAALKYVTPDKGNYTVTTWMDKDGNLTKNYVEGARMVRYNTQTFKYEKLTEKEINDALTSVIRANPQYIDSLKQDYDIAVDDFENGQTPMFSINNGTGQPISFEKFVDNIFNPMVKSKVYSHTELSKDDYNKNAYKEIEAMGLTQSLLSPTNIQGYSMPGENTVYTDNSYIISSMNVTKGNNSFRDSIKDIDGVTDEFINSVNLSNPEAFNRAIDSLDVDDSQKAFIRESYNTNRARYAEDLHNKAKFDALYGNSKGGAAKKTLSYIASGEFPDESNMNIHERRFANQWEKLNEFYFPKGSQKLMIVTPNKKTYDAFVRMAKDANLSEYFELNTDERGRYTIALDRSNNSKIIEFANLYQNARNEGKKGKPIKHFWHELGSSMEGGIIDFAFETFGGNLSWGEEILSIDQYENSYNLLNRVNESIGQRQDNEFTIGQTFSSIGDALTSSPFTEAYHKSHNISGKIFDFIPPVRNIRNLFAQGIVPDVGNMLQPVTDFSNRLNRVSTRNNFGTEKLVSNTSFRGATPEAIKAQARLDNGDYEDSTERNMLQNIVKDSDKATFEYIQMQSIRNADIEIVDKNGNFEEVHDLSDIEKLEKELRSAKSSDANSLVNIEYHRGKGRYGRTIQFVNSDDKIVKLWIDYDNINELTNLNNDPYLKSLRKFEEAQITENDIRLGSYNGIDIYASPSGNGNFSIISDGSNNPFNMFNSSDVNFELLRTVKEQEENLLMLSESLQNVTELDDETINNLADYIGNYITNLLIVLNINPEDQEARDLMYQDIARDTGFNFK